MAPQQLRNRLGLNVPHEWWPAAPLLKSFEAAGFGWTQVPAPPPEVLLSPRQCSRHGRSTGAALGTTGLRSVVHGPSRLRAGSKVADRVFEGLLSYAAEVGAAQVVYHARNLPDSPSSEDQQLAETRSLARLAVLAERLGLVIALENLAPVFPGPERLGHTPMVLRTLAHRISSPALGLCLDLGHAHIVADLRHADLTELVLPVLDSVTLFHVHDNLGARRAGAFPPELDPVRLDLHLPPGRGKLPWGRVAALLEAHVAPLLLEVHSPHRTPAADLHASTLRALGSPLPVETPA
jgi:sugar phosphate isomerase/epimerase